MSKKASLTGFVLLLCISSHSIAQIHGLPVTQTAEAAGKGTFQIMATTSHSDDLRLYGGRLGYGITENLLLFSDLGLLQDDQLDSEEFLAQLGIKYSLPLNLPFDLALRTSLIPYKANTEHYLEVTFGLLASKYLDAASKWAVYGGLGVDYQDIKLVRDLPAEFGGGTYVYDEDLTDASFVLGVSGKLLKSTTLFLEAVHVDHLFFNGGIRFEM